MNPRWAVALAMTLLATPIGCGTTPPPTRTGTVEASSAGQEAEPEYTRGLSSLQREPMYPADPAGERAVYARGFATGRLEAVEDGERWRDEHRVTGCQLGVVEMGKLGLRAADDACTSLKRSAFELAEFAGPRFRRESPPAGSAQRRAFELGYSMGFTHVYRAREKSEADQMRADVGGGCLEVARREGARLGAKPDDLGALEVACDRTADGYTRAYEAALSAAARDSGAPAQ